MTGRQMSDPVSQGDVADVLSSIRRLVAEEPTVAATTSRAATDKLILTPALRVISAGEGAGDVPEAPLSSELAPAKVPDLVVSIGAATDIGGTVWESETGDAWSADGDGNDVAALVRQAVAETPIAPDDVKAHPGIDAFPDASDPLQPSGVPLPDDGPTVLSAAEPFPRPPARQEIADPGRSAAGPVPPPSGPPSADVAALDGPFGVGDAVSPPQGDAVNHSEEGSLPKSSRSVPGSDDSVAADDISGASVRFAHRVPPVAAFPGFEDEEGLLDAEALRDLVRDLIRDELQGPLGERITRNLRKLVRIEVQRALAARALD